MSWRKTGTRERRETSPSPADPPCEAKEETRARLSLRGELCTCAKGGVGYCVQHTVSQCPMYSEVVMVCLGALVCDVTGCNVTLTTYALSLPLPSRGADCCSPCQADRQ